ncbi:single-stranded DNA-binding protein [Phenylobacterium sp.]|jgi:single-stranded DNA-binding protein|uniref:single-stranded DNA-binding protein n=1 Tax=Phenylobacterium sp. TaxID=1871053 RepID=UPI002E3338FE|nr:single-stranded DNA-binding protein [Phenylobacterium sp.]HEX4708965.1 single-stranded DNA-binding protein [Phenylobacterium sp.]
MQTVTVEGYLAADPSILAAQTSGKKRASFRLLETARFRRADGQMGERTTGFNCVCFNEAAAENYIAPYARTGTRVVVSGHVENDTWTGRDGLVHYDLRLVVEELRLKRRRDESPGESEVPRTFSLEDVDDEIPF